MQMALEMMCGYRLPTPYRLVLVWASLTAFAPSLPPSRWPPSKMAWVGEQAVLCAAGTSVEFSSSQAW